jgi:hypothetical protein
LISHDASHLNQVCAVIPANSQIVDVILNVTTANDDTTASSVSVGTVADADAFINAQSVQALGTTHGVLDTEATNVGTTDIQVLADFTATDGDGTAGVGTVTVMYLQNNSIASGSRFIIINSRAFGPSFKICLKNYLKLVKLLNHLVIVILTLI